MCTSTSLVTGITATVLGLKMGYFKKWNMVRTVIPSEDHYLPLPKEYTFTSF
jgi:hypothetical protein